MFLPNRSAIKRLQGLSARRHISKAADPDEAIRIIQIAKLSDERYAERFLAFDKFPFEKLDQDVAHARSQSVLAKLQDRTTGERAHGGL